ncbi:RNA-binding protein 28-like [Mytilus californianus]|uniref:RNA-binding protein 28-like n=1 Tax=Mytilus californianus TaxID=6549 RepID=UPI002246C3C3|nr:RNA-binding protein 28-like [Mytilus californianus]
MDERKSKTLFIRNLPFSTNNESLEKTFSDIGPLKQCFVVKNKGDEKCKGYGYVTFSLIEDAEKAKNQIKSVDKRKIYVNYANKKKDTKIKKSLSQKVENEEKQTKEPEEEKSEGTKKEEISYLKAKTLVVSGIPDEDQVETTLDKLKIKNISKIDYPIKGRNQLTVFVRFKSIRDLKKGQKKVEKKGLQAIQLSKENKEIPQKSLKQSRLIIRNLSFHCSEPHLKEVFSQFGEVKEVKIPKQPNGRMFGFGFVQFTDLTSAEQALQKMNTKMIRGRSVAVDWAVPKNKFEKDNKVESDGDSSSMEQDDDSASDTEASDESEDEESDESDEMSHSDDSGEEESDHSSGNDSIDEGFQDSSPSLEKKKRVQRDDTVEDGRTLFLRNLSYDTGKETLSEVMSEFGRVNYCLIVSDPKTEHSKGSGFVRFQTSEAAEACLQKSDDKGGGIIVDGRKLLIAKAVSRQKATELAKKEEKVKEDKRNLHLVREGLIRGGTKDAIGLSKQDIEKRQKIENSKRQRLKNPNIFVSTTRLCVHNLPKSIDEKELKAIFLKAAGKKAKITECRIMRDTERVNTKGVAKSRGYAFINFSDHQHAVEALRKTNNDPDLFNDNRRLIVEFSLENKNALLAKEKRLERFQARQKNLKQQKSVKTDDTTNEKDTVTNSKKERKKNKMGKQKEKITERYIGNVKLPDGSSIKNILPTHYGPKVRHKPRPQTGQQHQGKHRPQTEQQHQGKHRQQTEHRQEIHKESPVKQKKKKKTIKVDNFDKLVNSYKQKIMSSKATSKWFDN